MTKQHQVKAATSEAVELIDTALDRAAGGLQFYPLPRPIRLTSSDGTDKSITDGSSNTILKA